MIAKFHIFFMLIKIGKEYDMSNPASFDSFFRYSAFFDVNTNSILVANSFFHHINAHGTSVIYAAKSKNKDIGIVCLSDTFQHLVSEDGTCAIKLHVSNVLLKTLCFSDIAADYKTLEDGGTCVSLTESNFDISGLSLLRTNFYDHASIYFHTDSSGSLSFTNTSFGETWNGGSYVNGLLIRKQVSPQISYCAFAHLKGGHAILSLTEEKSQSHHVIFQNATAENDIYVIKSRSSAFHLDDCACYSCGPSIAETPIKFERWYFVDCQPDMNYFAYTVSAYEDFGVTINTICHVQKSLHKHIHSIIKSFLGAIFIVPIL